MSNEPRGAHRKQHANSDCAIGGQIQAVSYSSFAVESLIASSVGSSY